MIQDILPRYQEVATGSKTAFTFPFDVIKQDFIEVYLGTTKVTTGWTLSEKTITFTIAPEDGVVVTIYRNIPIEWVETNLGSLGQAGIENIGTYLVAQIQAIEEGLSRAIQTRITDTDKGEDISDDYLNSLAQATSLYGQCETLLEEIESTGEGDLEDMAEILQEVKDYRDEVIGMISTDTNLGNSDSVVPSQRAVKTYVDNGLSAKANDSEVVKVTGNQTIAGTKTFTETTSGANLVQSTSATATNSYVDFVQQINGSRRGTIRTAYNSDGSYQITLGCNGPDASSPTGVIVKRTSTTTTVTAPTPATSDNSTNIATTAFVKAQGYTTTDTKNTAGSTDTSSKIYLVGATSQAANPQTYSHDTVYVNTSGQLVSATPAVSSNSTAVATTGYVNTKFKKVSTLPASPDSNTFYFIPE